MSALCKTIPLADYLRGAASKPWRWGSHDCSAWPALWAGIPLPPYHDERGALDHIDAAGGLHALWASLIAESLQKVETPEPGDVGLIWAIGTDRSLELVGGIWNGRRWSFLTPKGIACASADHVAIWRAPCLRH